MAETTRKMAPTGSFEYAIYDVFSARPLHGNPLAVVFDADDLDGEVMQALAREFNLSETVFVLRPREDVHAARLRIFTPAAELPFAGHPTVGAAVAIGHRIARQRDLDGAEFDTVLMLEEAVGDVRCAVRLPDGGVSVSVGGFAEFDLPLLSEQVTCTVSPEEVAAALGLGPSQIGFENHRISVWSAGVPFVLVPLRNLAAIEQCNVDAVRWQRLAPVHKGHLADAYVYCRGGIDHAAAFHARMFAPGVGIAEDPATGSAVAALSGAIHSCDALLDGPHPMMVEQGIEMGRPSRIHLHMEIRKGEIIRARIGGDAVRVAEGTLTL